MIQRFHEILFKIICALFVAVAGVSCSDGEKAVAEPRAKVDIASTVDKVVSKPIYDRGYADGRRIAGYAANSQEREAALLRAHALISSLSRAGYRQSAIDYSAGLEAALNN